MLYFESSNTEIYNPWSVINYISKGCIPQAYWVNTGKNEILEDVLKVVTDDITEKLYALLQGEKVIARIDQNVVYRSLSEEPANKIAESLYVNDYKKLQKAIAEYMDKSISFYDAGTEGFYHGLVLGLIALMDNHYKIKSNRESGEGRYDISLITKEERYPAIIMELKWKKGMSAEGLSGLADEAIDQIDDMRYDAEMKEDGIRDILKFGIAFSGKKVSVKTK